MKQPFSLVLLPGLGADHRLFRPQRARFPDLSTPQWLAPESRETITDYAGRLAETVPVARPMVLGGVSFGGMVAWEMANFIEPDALVLISSCASRRGIRSAYRLFRPFVPLLPGGLVDAAKPLSAAALALFTRLSPDQRRLCATMFTEADSCFMRWTMEAVLDWNPALQEGMLVRQIHGQRDRIIPACHVKPDAVIPEGGHLINLTHAEQVNEFIQEVADTITASDTQ